ncbi:S8 family serine peptidase [uncultured Lutibacter sp.]|uniref:S8 family peptidase n=1 Tax=uncultured Lutibacter sp. TaxID=437739 RepID=UPI00262D2F43|nr:S8 family serine peptidase [uncultured Lutibacter sp.]
MKKLLLSLFTILALVSCQTESLNEIISTNESIDLEGENSFLQAKNSSGKNSFMVIAQAETLSHKLEFSIKKHGEIVRTIPEIGIAIVKSSNPNFEQNVSKISGVRSVVPDLTVNWLEPINVQPMANPASIGDDDTYFNIQWGLDAIDAPEAWNAGYQGSNTKVFILDSGIDAEHPDLAPNLNTQLSKSFVPNEDWNIQPGLYINHGTHVAGIIAAVDNDRGVIGVAPMTEIVAVKVLSEYTGSGSFGGINAGIVYAANNSADVINMSLGTTLNKNGKFYDEDGNYEGKIPSKYIQEIVHAQQRAIDYAYKKGVTIVTSAGNSGMNADGNGSAIVMPADLNNVITVSATAPFAWVYNPTPNLDEFASYSNYGTSLVDIAAPGGDYDSPYDFWWYDMVYSTVSEGYTWLAGTSMASPHVAGVAALIIGKNGGEMAPHEVAKQLYNTADKIDTNGASDFYGKGRVNAYRAVTE